jgi:hypothetical protein
MALAFFNLPSSGVNLKLLPSQSPPVARVFQSQKISKEFLT